MTPSLRTLFALGLVPLFFLAGCPTPEPSGTDGGSADASTSDAGPDGGLDGGIDAGVDAGLDAGTDGGVDAGMDAGVDAGTDAGMDAGVDAGMDGGTLVMPTPGTFCALPGSFVYGPNGQHVVIGSSTVDLSWMTVPPGFCVHYFGNVGNARQIRFAPGGELFVASPTGGTTSGGVGGKAEIDVLADDNHDGYAESKTTFLSQVNMTEGMLFAPGYFYYQDLTCIRRLPYQSGQRVAGGNGETAGTDICANVNGAGFSTNGPRNRALYGSGVINITSYASGGHWPKTLGMADDGTIYVSNGGDQGEQCIEPMPFHGGIWKVDGTDGGMPVVKGLRNPIALKCQHGHNHCFAAELAQDYSWSTPGAEKILLVHEGDNWGYPCCADQNLPYVTPQQLPDGGQVLVEAYQQTDGGLIPIGTPDCSQITPTTNAFEIAETPFGLDFEYGSWPAPWTNRMFVALHGQFASWFGARVVAIETDPATGIPQKSSDLDGGVTTTMSDFATGWDDGRMDHGRPTDLAMSADGRLYLSNDWTGDIVWIAPVQ